MAVRMAAPALRALDRAFVGADSSLAANSEFIRDRIRYAWDKDATVIYPPVEVSHIGGVKWGDSLGSKDSAILETLPEIFLLGASRFVEYKGLDKVIQAGELSGIPVVIAGSGPLQGVLASRGRGASVPVTLIHSPSDSLLFALYQRALAFVFPPVEDFGIMPVEAMAAGCPVIVNAVGGTGESVIEGVSGYHLDTFTGDELVSAIGRAAMLDRTAVCKSAMRFESSRFRDELGEWVSASG